METQYLKTELSFSESSIGFGSCRGHQSKFKVNFTLVPPTTAEADTYKKIKNDSSEVFHEVFVHIGVNGSMRDSVHITDDGVFK